MERVQKNWCGGAAVVFISIVLIAELLLLFCDYQEGMIQYHLRRDGYAFIKVGGYDEPASLGQTNRYHQDWLGLESCKVLLRQNGHWLFTPEQDQMFSSIELLVVEESENILSLYNQLYNQLTNAQLKLFLSPDKVLTPYASAGAEGSDLRTYLSALSTLRRTANLQNEKAWQELRNNEKKGTSSSASASSDIASVHQLKVSLPSLNTSPLPLPQAQGFEDTESRRSLLHKAQELELHPLRILLSLKELCLISENRLSTQQAQNILILIERLRISTLRLEALYQNAKCCVPKSTWDKMMLYPELKVLEKRIVQELPYIKTVNRTLKLLNTPSELDVRQRRLNPRIPPLEVSKPSPRPIAPPPPPPPIHRY
ncbi:MAG: hypothetical protein ACI376_05640 [Candidatus Bruticola sp.]